MNNEKISLEIIPKNWEIVKIEDIADVKGGKRLPKGEMLTKLKSNHPYIRVSDMYMGGIDLSDILYVPDEVYRTISNYTISKEDLFISVAGTLGIVGKVPDELDGASLTENADKLTNIKCNKDFLLQVLISPIVQDSIEKDKTNNAQPKLALTRIKQFQIPLPPLPEQQKIAEILSTVDEKIEVIDQQIEQTKQLKKGLMQRLLTKGIGHTKFKDSVLGEIPESWEVVSLIDVCENNKYSIVDGPFGSNLKTEHYKTEGIPIISSGFVTDCKFKADKYLYVDEQKFILEKRSAVKGGDIVMAKIGARCGASAIFPSHHQTSILSGNSLKISIDQEKHSNKFYWYLLLYYYDIGEINKIRTTGAQPAISISNLKKIKVPVVTKEEQVKIANVIESIADREEILKSKQFIYQTLKKGLMQKLLTGTIRVNHLIEKEVQQ